jgi:asparagine synthase (glutamine-hydrolysing)
MSGTLAHRGPDGSGVWVDTDARCAFGHRRLSIIDTSDAGSQPFVSSDGRWWLTFNGEIYNFKEIRVLLEQRGRRFRSQSDTEVLIEALAEWGTSAIEKFDGMFAFAAFDTRRAELILARDPFGEKPLYYTTLADGTFAFASELRALEILPGFHRTISLDAIAEYLMFQYVGAPRSIYENVAKLPPAQILRKSQRATETQIYYRFDPGREVFVGRSNSDLADELEDILLRSIERRLIADVPLGAFLSGGVDSSLFCALATQKLRVPLNTYTIGFQGAPETSSSTERPALSTRSVMTKSLRNHVFEFSATRNLPTE